MEGKGQNPHLLVMTATPIPRTLAMTLYGDMDISMINEYPEGHRPVITRLVRGSRKRAVFETLKKRMSQGEQAFVICPVIERSEALDLKNVVEMTEKLKKILEPSFRVGLVHGQMSPEERERIMEDFRQGSVDLLVGTTVVEVGVHIPGATMMIIEHPERFGLIQIHQLRGRVGRGSERGLCVLMVSEEVSDKSITRLEILADTHNGSEIAQKDLELRGQGELIGMRQAGTGELEYSDILREPELLLKAGETAQSILAADPELLAPGNEALRAMVSTLLSSGEPRLCPA